MRFTSIAASAVALLAFASTSVVAHGTHQKGPDSVELLQRYFQDNGYTAREIMDEYELFRRAGSIKRKKSGSRSGSVSSLIGKLGKFAVNNADQVATIGNTGTQLLAEHHQHKQQMAQIKTENPGGMMMGGGGGMVMDSMTASPTSYDSASGM